jgi:cell division septal protein FtsQ
VRGSHWEERVAAGRGPALTVVLLGVGFLALVATHWQERQAIGRIDVRGASALSEAAVRRVVDTLLHHRVGRLSFADVRASVERLPYVQGASVFMAGTRDLVVEVVEREPVAHVVMGDGQLRYVDAAGTVLPRAEIRTGHNVPVIVGIGSEATKGQLEQVIGIVNVASSVLDPVLRQSISEIRRDTPSNDLLIVTDGIVWRVSASDCTAPQSVLRKMNVFWTSIRKTLDVRSVAEFDLRWDRQVVVRYKAGGTSSQA